MREEKKNLSSIRIGCGSGFWGDWLDAPKQLVSKGKLDYLVLDYLAEVTMSILSKQKSRDPELGYAKDFVELISELGPELAERKIKVISNAGGVNPLECGKKLAALLAAQGLSDRLKIAVVTGDDILSKVESLSVQGISLENLDSGAPFSEVRNRIQSANVYLGADTVVDALKTGATIIITGRVADAALALAPMVYEFKWAWDDWDKLASGTVAGHLIECGAQATGGNLLDDWESVPDLWNIGYPIVEVSKDSSFVLTKPEETGGRVCLKSAVEQLVYEIADPKAYVVPDVTVDFTSAKLEQVAENQVGVSGVKGSAKPDRLKVSMSYAAGYGAEGTLVYSWPDAYKKAKAAAEIIKQRLKHAGVELERFHAEVIGVNACHGALTDCDIPNLPEAVCRIAAQSQDKAALERFTREIAPLVLNGPPSATAYSGGKGQIKEIFAYWPALIPRKAVTADVHKLWKVKA